jgi:hypothetical protein
MTDLDHPEEVLVRPCLGGPVERSVPAAEPLGKVGVEQVVLGNVLSAAIVDARTPAARSR